MQFLNMYKQQAYTVIYSTNEIGYAKNTKKKSQSKKMDKNINRDRVAYNV